MMEVQFHKMHGLENDFVIIDSRKKEIHINDSIASRVADRKTGIGCDQVIIMYKSDIADAKVFVFNKDGSMAEICGNAIRCLALLLEKTKSVFELSNGNCIETGIMNKDNISANMGQAHFSSEKVGLRNDQPPLSLSFEHPIYKKGHAISFSNPHLVFFDDFRTRDEIMLGNAAFYFEEHHYFSNRINVHFAHVEKPGNIIYAKSWERGVGWTNACGSGAGAIARIAYELKMCNSRSNIIFSGGKLNLSILDDMSIIITGPARHCFTGTITL